MEERFLGRATRRKLGQVEVPVAAAEDIIVMKVLAGRRKDEDDVLAIISAQQKRLDLNLIRDTLQDLTEALAQDDLLPMFERLLREATRG